VLDQEDRELALELAQQRDHAHGFLRAHARHRLVEQQHPRPRRERHADLELPVLAVAHARDHHVLAPGKADAREQLARGLAQDGLLAGVAPEPERMPVVRLHRQRHVVERGEIVEQRGDLERARQPERAAAVNRQRRDVRAGEADAAGVGRDLAGQLADQRGLAGPIWADDGVQLSRWQQQGDAIGGDNAAEALGQAVDLEKRVSHGAGAPAIR
jgi:hypothetical protein